MAIGIGKGYLYSGFSCNVHTSGAKQYASIKLIRSTRIYGVSCQEREASHRCGAVPIKFATDAYESHHCKM